MPTKSKLSDGVGLSLGSTSDDKLDRGVLLVAGVVVLGAIMSILDITVVSVAQPTFQSEFDASPAEAAWTMTGYTLAMATVIPLSGWAADRFGTKRLYMMAVSISMLVASAHSAEPAANRSTAIM